MITKAQYDSIPPRWKIVIGENMFNYDKWNAGNFHLCDIEMGKIFQKGDSENNDDEDDDFSNYGDKDNKEIEKKEIPKENYFDDVEDDAFVAAFSHSNTNELCCILKLGKQLPRTT